MIYPEAGAADFRTLGYERRDDAVPPRVKLVTARRSHVIFHIAGEAAHRLAHVADLVRDADLIAGMDPAEALQLGVLYASPQRGTDEDARGKA